MQERSDFGIFYFRIRDGESATDFFDRTSAFLETMHRDFNKYNYPKNALPVIHVVTLIMFIMRLLHWSVEEFEDVLNPKNCEVLVLELNDADDYELVMPLRIYTVST